MKCFIAQFLMCAGIVSIAFAVDLEYFSISTNQAAAMKQKIDRFENGTFSLEDMNEKAGVEGNRELIGYYLSHSNDIPTKVKLPVGRSFAGFNMFPEAVELGTQYVSVYSNDWHGWRLLGAVYDSLSLSNKSVHAYGNAVRLGGREGEYEALAAVAIKYNRLDVVRGMIPQLMAMKNAKETPVDSKLHLISILLAYSMKVDDREIFIATLKGENMDDILQDDAVKYDVTNGCNFFEGIGIDKKYRGSGEGGRGWYKDEWN